MSRVFFVAGCLMAMIAVMAGAFGAHALEGRVTPERLQTFETAARYQMYHALALIMCAWAVTQWPGVPGMHWAGFTFLAGILLFSGSLYLLVLTDTPWLGAITPLGGAAFIAGWLLLAWTAATSR
jgi:uncharacterized membrane protein YgdD (TMEM256/DUF423 family)